MAAGDMVLVGVIVGAHGVRGAVRVKSFTEAPEGVAAYGPVFDETGAKRFELRVLGPTKGGIIAQLSGVTDRNAAEALRGLRLHVPRAALPAPAEEEFYHADLVGLTVQTVDGEVLGTVRAVQNYGAGDLIEVERPGMRSLELPFTRAVVPLVDLAAGRLVVDPPPGLVDGAPVPAEAEA
jgi:16S rRNA processing protein RimM